MGEISLAQEGEEVDFEKMVTTGFEVNPGKSALWQTFVKDVGPDIHDAEGQNSILTHYCEQGWELVSVQGQYAYFKRVNPEWVRREEAKMRQGNFRRPDRK